MNDEGVDQFCADRLTIARERRSMTQRRLSEIVGVSDRMIKAYEAGAYHPTADTLREIAKALRFPSSFFEGPPIERLALGAASFRSLSKASASLRSRAVASGSLALELHRYLADRFDMPKPDIPDLRHVGPAQAADVVRHAWGIGQRPIANVVHVLELHGVRVFSLSEDCDAIDAFSVWRDGVPFVFLNNRKTPERSIFDAAHELGHLVLHRHGRPRGRELEGEADAFAGNFLLPEAAIRASAPRLATVATLASMKSTWHASVAAIAYRLHELGLMSEWHYRRLNIELTRRVKDDEPSPLPRETSAIMRKALRSLAAEGVTLRDIATELCLPLGELQALAFGLDTVDGGGATTQKKHGLLRLVSTGDGDA